MTGTVEKWSDGESRDVYYKIGDIFIRSPAPIPELEEKIGREIVLKVEEGFPLRTSLKKDSRVVA